MQFIRALSLAPAADEWLANSHDPRILHVFDHVCNLINEQRDVLSIVPPQIGNGPFNLVLADEICFLEHCNSESLISFSPAQFTVGNLLIHTADMKLWNPCPDWNGYHAHRDKIANQITQLQITNYLRHGGFGHLLLHQPGLPITQSLISSLCSSFAIADLPSSRLAVQELAGLGPGLTPSGDDFLMGAIYAAWIIHPFEIASVLARDVAETAAPRTTSLSGAWLRAAGRGEAGILWHQLFDPLLVNRIANPTFLEEPIKNILAVGETSGADALAGFIGVFVSWMERAGSSHA
jgi:Protein of unknown function (DUF2877)